MGGGGRRGDGRNFFSLSNSGYEFFFLGHSMNIVLGLIGVQEFSLAGIFFWYAVDLLPDFRFS